MEICDRHFSKGEYIARARTITNNSSETFHLCESCYQDFKSFLDISNMIKKEGKKTNKRYKKKEIKK